MTNKEAIDYLAIIYERSRNGKRAYHNKYQDAFDMAIEALKIEPCDDVVSRKAAIEAVEFGITYAKAINKSTGEVKELFKEGNKALNEAVERLKELPSARPEVIRCKECAHWLPHSQLGFDEDNGEYHDYCGRLIPDDEYYAFYRNADDYCSRAERRTDDQD